MTRTRHARVLGTGVKLTNLACFHTHVACAVYPGGVVAASIKITRRATMCRDRHMDRMAAMRWAYGMAPVSRVHWVAALRHRMTSMRRVHWMATRILAHRLDVLLRRCGGAGNWTRSHTTWVTGSVCARTGAVVYIGCSGCGSPTIFRRVNRACTLHL